MCKTVRQTRLCGIYYYMYPSRTIIVLLQKFESKKTHILYFRIYFIVLILRWKKHGPFHLHQQFHSSTVCSCMFASIRRACTRLCVCACMFVFTFLLCTCVCEVGRPVRVTSELSSLSPKLLRRKSHSSSSASHESLCYDNRYIYHQ